ncbi:MAG: polysaccharide deacetylase family protein [Deltaproteobacteria bacterium]|nr:polysaccharide deacetylase family protein [Deltaproteobacteria bacterium]
MADGHELGNHTQDHRGAVRECSGECLRRSVLETDELIRQHQPGPPRYFRFPYGEANCAAVETVRALGYRVVGWQIDTVDWDFARDGTSWRAPGYEHDFEGWVHRSAAVAGGGVLLMHDIHANTANRLDSILTGLEEAGFVFVSLDSGYFPRLDAGPDEMPWMEGPAAIPPGPDGGVVARIEIESSIMAREVAIKIDVEHPRPDELAVTVEREGRSFALARDTASAGPRLRAVFPIPELADSDLQGEWTLGVLGPASAEPGTLRAWSIVRGQ